MEMKKYLSGVVFLVLFSSVCAEGPVTAKDKVKDFYNKNKTAVVATSAALGTAVIALGGAFAYGKCNTIVGERDLKSLSEEVIASVGEIAENQTRIDAIEEELKSSELDKEVKTKLKNESSVLKDVNKYLKANLFANLQIANAKASLVEVPASTDAATEAE